MSTTILDGKRSSTERPAHLNDAAGGSTKVTSSPSTIVPLALGKSALPHCQFLGTAVQAE